jgi:hypothetical protein
MIQFQIIVKRGSAMGIYVVAQIYMFQQWLLVMRVAYPSGKRCVETRTGP